MIQTMLITELEIRKAIEEAAKQYYPGITVDEMLYLMKNTIAFDLSKSLQQQRSLDLIKDDVRYTHLVHLDSSDDPMHEDEEYDDPKEDFGFWRTDIRVSLS